MKKSITILLVEDDASMLRGIHDLLLTIDVGYEIDVITANNGLVAYQILQEQPMPDLIISDIMMPKMDGYAFLERVRANPDWFHIPFIFLTAKGDKKDKQEGALSGANLYITKPFETMELMELIKTQLDRSFRLQLTHQQQVDDLKKGILQILNHEFRTPLTYVTAYYEMLADSVDQFTDEKNFQEYLRGIQAGCVRLNRLVDDFVQFIELRTGEAFVKYKQRAHVIDDIEEVLQEVIDEQAARAKAKGITIHYHDSGRLPSVFGVRSQLSNIFSRLLSNAIKFTHNPQKEEKQIAIHATVENRKLHISIADEGVGFPPHLHNRIFDLFFQHNRNLMEQQGAGVGLTIVRGMINLHQGHIEVQSEEDKGSTFRVTLPIYDGVPIAEQPVRNGENGRRQATVLVVEDEQFLLEGLQELLEIYNGKYELNVLTASDGQQGLAVMEKYKPDLIISDIMMPHMDGYEFLHEVRQNSDWLQIPFIFLTAKGERPDIHEGLKRGVEAYIVKPYDSDALLELVVTHLDRHFRLQGMFNQDFETLKRSIVNLINPDFRLPLTSVSKYSQALATSFGEAKNDAELKESLRGIQQGSKRLSRLIEDFISLAELKTGEAETAHALRAQPIHDIGVIFCEAGQACSRLAEKRSVQIHCNVNAELPPVYGNANTILESVKRLVEVGIKHCRNHQRRDVYLQSTAVNQEVRLEIQLTYTIDEEKLTQMQTILHQDDVNLSELPDYAPALLITKEYIALNNGRLELDSGENHGCHMAIFLPVHHPSPEEPATPTA